MHACPANHLTIRQKTPWLQVVSLGDELQNPAICFSGRSEWSPARSLGCVCVGVGGGYRGGGRPDHVTGCPSAAPQSTGFAIFDGVNGTCAPCTCLVPAWTALTTIAVPANSTVEYRAGSVSGTFHARISTPVTGGTVTVLAVRPEEQRKRKLERLANASTFQSKPGRVRSTPLVCSTRCMRVGRSFAASNRSTQRPTSYPGCSVG
jgi:hypothetical protein